MATSQHETQRGLASGRHFGIFIGLSLLYFPYKVYNTQCVIFYFLFWGGVWGGLG